MSLLRVTHEGSVCLQEKVQISSIIRHLSTSSGPLSLISLCPTGLCTAPKYAFFPPVFRALLLPLPLSGTPCLPSSVKSYLLPSLESPALAGSPPRSHWSGRNFLCLPTAPPCFPTVVLPIFPHPSVHITVGACRSWAHGSGLMVFFLVLGLERQPRPCPHPPDQGEKYCLGASLGFLPLTDYDLTSPNLGFLICKMKILTPVIRGLR